MTEMARMLGLSVCETFVLPLPSGPVLVATRYDRLRQASGAVVRLHQEDLCQALGVMPNRKYEAEGGPFFVSCYRTVVEHSREPFIDGCALLQWLAFNAVVGNADGHAKNLSLLRQKDASLRLAPFYDLVCTSVYQRMDRRLAMRIGTAWTSGTIRGRDWSALAAELEVRPRFLLELVDDLAGRLYETARSVAATYRACAKRQLTNRHVAWDETAMRR